MPDRARESASSPTGQIPGWLSKRDRHGCSLAPVKSLEWRYTKCSNRPRGTIQFFQNAQGASTSLAPLFDEGVAPAPGACGPTWEWQTHPALFAFRRADDERSRLQRTSTTRVARAKAEISWVAFGKIGDRAGAPVGTRLAVPCPQCGRACAGARVTRSSPVPTTAMVATRLVAHLERTRRAAPSIAQSQARTTVHLLRKLSQRPGVLARRSRLTSQAAHGSRRETPRPIDAPYATGGSSRLQAGQGVTRGMTRSRSGSARNRAAVIQRSQISGSRSAAHRLALTSWDQVGGGPEYLPGRPSAVSQRRAVLLTPGVAGATNTASSSRSTSSPIPLDVMLHHAQVESAGIHQPVAYTHSVRDLR